MIHCPYCNAEMPDPTEPCPECGRPLPEADGGETMVVSADQRPAKTGGWQSADVSEDLTLTLEINGAPIPVQLSTTHPVSMGREEEAHIDLSPFDAHEKGVSGLHAELGIEGGMVQIRDLESTNGTYINGRELTPFQWNYIRNKDELYLGRLRIIVKLI